MSETSQFIKICSEGEPFSANTFSKLFSLKDTFKISLINISKTETFCIIRISQITSYNHHIITEHAQCMFCFRIIAIMQKGKGLNLLPSWEINGFTD